MYKSFYNLKRNPFEIIPDPFFFFPTPRHNEALAALYHGVRGHKGFAVLTGDIGTGKTLLLRCLLELLKRSDDVAYAYVFNGRLSPCEFLQYVASDFGLPVSGKNKSEILSDLSKYVVARGLKKLTTRSDCGRGTPSLGGHPRRNPAFDEPGNNSRQAPANPVGWAT